jgi:iron-sulfur cluster repair protein YtfE (RIC family)
VTEHETMNTIIHAAFRRDLARFDTALAAFVDGDRQRAGALKAAWDNVAFQLHHHHTDEETIFWPALRELGADEALVGDLDGEHQRMLAALSTAEAAMERFATEPSAANAQAVRASLGELHTVLTDHLAHEERDLEPFTIAQRNSPQLKAANTAVRKAHKGNVGTFFTWLQDGADADTLRGLRAQLPPPVLFLITSTAGRDYRRRIAPVWSA